MSDGDSVGLSWHAANPAQKGLWVLDKIAHLRRTSMMPAVVEFTGPVQLPLLVAAVRRVLARHPSLRSRFRLNAQLRRVEYRTDAGPADVGFTDAAAAGWTAERVTEFVDSLCYTPFDLASEPPARAEVIRVAGQSALLVFTVHHIVCDGWSRTLLLTEIRDTYKTLAGGRDPSLPAPPHPADVTTMAERESWPERVPGVVRRLAGAPLDIEVPFGRAGEATSLSGASMSARLDNGLGEQLLEAAARQGCTPFMIGVALLAGTLVRAGSGQRDFLFAFGWPGRDDPGTAGAVGMFMNTSMIRVSVSEDDTWDSLLRHVRLRALEAYLDADVPLEGVTAGLKPDRDTIWPPLSPVLVNMHEAPGEMNLGPEIQGSLQPLPALHMKYDLGFFVSVTESPGRRQLDIAVDYRDAIYDPDALAGFLRLMKSVARGIAYSPEEKVIEQEKELDLSTEESRIEFVRRLWREILGTDDISDDVSFFDAGGDSLLLVMLVERMSQESGHVMKTIDIFRAGTVRGHAGLLAAEYAGK